ncbi:IGR protein motif-domain-containing protein [Collybia nuda]|uniref:Small ribosomal subunit protein mS41 n=1 Tax=Collybia nuda TaxID=64659 RepID=A0A9P6CJQ0_9AGAR|nr:IGR protein motif-domain-containing protein [Collybia nuda]
MFSVLGSSSRLSSLVPRLSRSLVNRAASRPVPPPLEPISTPSDFLKAIGRSSETKVTIESWDEFWKTSGNALKKSGLAVRDRRYILWCMENYRNGQPIQSFAHEPKPKKAIRGWGPAVQNGKRIRSRRLKNQK